MPPSGDGNPAFFASFLDYRVVDSLSILDNFKLLSIQRGWSPGSPTWRRNWRNCFARPYTANQNPFSFQLQQDRNPIFDCIPDFTPGPSLSVHEEFARLSRYAGWNSRPKKYNQHWEEFLYGEFVCFFGRDEQKLANWQKLCQVVGVPVGVSITKCKKALQARSVHINLINLLNHVRNATRFPLMRFTGDSHFKNYTRNHAFPKNVAKAEGFVKVLLRGIF